METFKNNQIVVDATFKFVVVVDATFKNNYASIVDLILLSNQIILCWGKFLETTLNSTYVEAYAILEGNFKLINLNLPENIVILFDSLQVAHDFMRKELDSF